MRGTNIPLVVLVTSSSDDALGVVVPMPAGPEDGNVFCALIEMLKSKSVERKKKILLISKLFLMVLVRVFMLIVLLVKRKLFGKNPRDFFVGMILFRLFIWSKSSASCQSLAR